MLEFESGTSTFRFWPRGTNATERSRERGAAIWLANPDCKSSVALFCQPPPEKFITLMVLLVII